jgi:hypothetical protein
MDKFEVGETYVSHPDFKLYRVLRRTEKTVTLQDETVLTYKKRINKKYSDILEAECFFMGNNSLITAKKWS